MVQRKCLDLTRLKLPVDAIMSSAGVGMTEMRAQFDRLYMLAACLCIPMFLTTAQAAASDRVKINAQSPFLIDRTEVTIARFKAFVSTSGLKTKAERDGGGGKRGGGKRGAA